MRLTWPLPSDEELRNHITSYHSDSVDERLERYKFIWQEFGPPTDMLLGGGLVSFPAFLEIRHTYIEGCFLACALLVQLFLEDALGNTYIIRGEEQLAEQGFARLIDKALEDGMIDADLTGKLHQLRQMRNPYVHPRAGLGNRTLMKRVVEGYGSLELQAQEDAKTAVQIMIDFLRYSARKGGNL